MTNTYQRSANDDAVARLMRQRIRPTVARYQTSVPVPVERYTQEWGIPVVDAVPSATFEALSAFSDGYQVVFVNRQRPETAQRFALAHEVLGHGWHH